MVETVLPIILGRFVIMKNKPFNRDEEHAFWIERHKKFRDGRKAVGHVGESDQLNIVST